MGMAAVVIADPTLSIVNPIADTLGHREVSIYYSLTGGPRFRSSYDHYTSVTVGLLDRFELGMGKDCFDCTTWDLKANLWDSPSWAPNTALSVGIMNVEGRNEDHYAVGRVDFGCVRLHGGYGRFGGINTGLIGLDVDLQHWGSAQADHIGGPDGYTWVAHTYNFERGLYAQLAAGKPNRASNGWTHMLTVGYGFSF